jgi:hypothetical protein
MNARRARIMTILQEMMLMFVVSLARCDGGVACAPLPGP